MIMFISESKGVPSPRHALCLLGAAAPGMQSDDACRQLRLHVNQWFVSLSSFMIPTSYKLQ